MSRSCAPVPVLDVGADDAGLPVLLLVLVGVVVVVAGARRHLSTSETDFGDLELSVSRQSRKSQLRPCRARRSSAVLLRFITRILFQARTSSTLEEPPRALFLLLLLLLLFTRCETDERSHHHSIQLAVLVRQRGTRLSLHPDGQFYNLRVSLFTNRPYRASPGVYQPRDGPDGGRETIKNDDGPGNHPGYVCARVLRTASVSLSSFLPSFATLAPSRNHSVKRVGTD